MKLIVKRRRVYKEYLLHTSEIKVGDMCISIKDSIHQYNCIYQYYLIVPDTSYPVLPNIRLKVKPTKIL